MNAYKKLRRVADSRVKRNKEEEVAKENDIILDKINKIYSRAPVSTEIGVVARSTSMKVFKSEILKKAPSAAKNEEIDRENLKIADRIIGSKSRMESTKDLSKKYSEHLKHKMRLSHYSHSKHLLPMEKTRAVAEKLIAMQTGKSRCQRSRTTKST